MSRQYVEVKSTVYTHTVHPFRNGLLSGGVSVH